jgi:xanthine/CO dehydrogenase XdhC/CoxF family maturation factor
MTLLEQLQAAAENARKGLPAALTIDADGVQYTRNFMPQERLILLGGGTIAQPLCRYAADLGFELVVADDRPSFANHPRFPQSRLYVICFRRQSRKSASERAITLPLSRAGIVMTRTACGSFCAAPCRAISA